MFGWGRAHFRQHVQYLKSLTHGGLEATVLSISVDHPLGLRFFFMMSMPERRRPTSSLLISTEDPRRRLGRDAIDASLMASPDSVSYTSVKRALTYLLIALI